MLKSRLFLVIIILGSLTGCGQSGPLYLPGDPPPIYVPEDLHLD